MIEKYVKPAMVIERFELTSAIARNCADLGLGGNPTLNREGNCGWEIAPGTILFTLDAKCNWPVEDGFDLGSGMICYNTPTDSATLFTS